MAADLSATTMLHIIDNLLPDSALQDLRDLCDIHGRLKEEHDGDAQFSWRPETGSPRSIHAAAQQAVVDHYLDEALLPLATPFASQRAGVEWWCNTNNDLDWHIDKDELEGRRSGRFLLPLLSTLFYPHVSCAGGELLVADSPPIENGYQGPLPTFRSVISIPPVVNRLVLFSPGILHRINPFEGERYSVAVNIWEQAPLTTTAAEPPA